MVHSLKKIVYIFLIASSFLMVGRVFCAHIRFEEDIEVLASDEEYDTAEDFYDESSGMLLFFNASTTIDPSDHVDFDLDDEGTLGSVSGLLGLLGIGSILAVIFRKLKGRWRPRVKSGTVKDNSEEFNNL